MATLSSSPSSITITKMLVMILPLMTAPVVARELGPSDRGVYGACIAAVTLIPVLVGLGVPIAVRRRASLESYPEIIRSVYFLVPILIAPAALLAWGVREVFTPELSLMDTVALVCSVSLSTVTVLTLSLQSILIVKRQYLRIAGLQSVQTVFITLGTLVGWTLGALTISWLIWSAALGALIAVVVGVFTTRVSLSGNRVKLAKLVGEGLSFSGSQVSEVAANTIVQIMAVSIIGSHDSGLFAVSMTIAGLPLVLGHTVGIVSFQHVASASKEVGAALAAAAFRSALILGLLASVLLSAVSPIVIPIMFGSEYADAVPIALIACGGSWLLVVNYVSSQLLAAQGRGWAMTVGQFTGLVLTVVVLFFLGPPLGGVGAAISVVFGRVCTFAITVAYLPGSKKALIVRPADCRRAFALVIGGKLVA